jgi:sulfoxide reductase heme-binding subunit YedZ
MSGHRNTSSGSGDAKDAGRSRRTVVRLLKVAVWALGLAPLAWLGGRIVRDDLGANPIEELIHFAGTWALVILLAALAVTPVRRLVGWNVLAQIRRPVGLFAFFYASLHMLSYFGLDQGFAWTYIVEDVVERPYITVGTASFLILLALAATSTRGWIRRLGRRWQRLHRLVYVAATLGVVHFYWQVKADTRWPLVAALVLAILLGARVWWWLRAGRRAARGSASSAGRGSTASEVVGTG